ncbi:lipase b precursor [Colletotrichum truncatum]|uniref:Lipase b n=1 Tax=Colletotrichum truncatum TaxID=5467 RepID=A0ACC3Z302_COLTU|nr:lipase b precursor [Colletotrichum truncatum]KAF6793233.1 lipase b precursor [Colletotrichum truncatum]
MRSPLLQTALVGLLIGSADSAPAGLLDGVTQLLTLPTNYVQLLSGILNTQPSGGAQVLDAADLQSKLGSIWNTNQGGSGDFYGNIKKQINLNIVPSGVLPGFRGLLGEGGLLGNLNLASIANKLLAPINSIDSSNNVNPLNPANPVYPKKNSADAPYTLTEQQLRQAIFIPKTFTYGQKPPVIFIPGTGVYAGETFSANLLKLLTNVPYADPVLLNIPDALLADAQVNSEFVAYAINYITGISNQNASIISWSQGGLDTQWAFTFWPSTRSAVSNFFPVSPDFHGTVLANVLCLSPGSGALNAPCSPSVIQQQYTSLFIQTLRARGGADAYVPTTTFYSALLDEVVQPQAGTTASAYLNDARRVGVNNIEVQSVCAGRPAGSLYGHATVLFNPLTAALIKDALQNKSPAQVSRINLNEVCKDFIAPGLSLEDGVATAGAIVPSAIRLLAYLPKLIAEPALKSYVHA